MRKYKQKIDKLIQTDLLSYKVDITFQFFRTVYER